METGSTTTEDGKSWREHVACWRKSGLTQMEYSRKHGIKACTLSYWNGKAKKATSPKAKFVPVVVQPEQKKLLRNFLLRTLSFMITSI